MRVLLGHCFYRSSAPSGEDSVYRNEKKMLEENGFEVICFEKFNDDLDNESILKKSLSGINFIWSTSAYQEMLALIKKTKPDVAHFHNIFPQMSSSVYSACREMGVPVVQTLHNFRYICPNGLLQRDGKPCELCIDHSLINSIKHSCYRNSLVATLPMAAMIQLNRTKGQFDSGVSRYIALSEFSKGRFVKAGFNPDQIVVKQNFVEDPIVNQSVSGDYVVYIGRLTQEKGIERLVEASKQLKDIPIKVLGDGELKGKIESQVIQHNLNIELLGQQPKNVVLQYIKNSRFVVVPSECYENFPVTIAEAYACGKSVLATAIGSLNELVESGITGEKFDFGSTDDLVQKCQLMWNDSKLIESMNKKARARYETYYTPAVNLEKLKIIYEGVCRKN